MRVAGDTGMPLVVTGTGETMHAAREHADDRIDDIVIPNMYYRTTSGSDGGQETAIGCRPGAT